MSRRGLRGGSWRFLIGLISNFERLNAVSRSVSHSAGVNQAAFDPYIGALAQVVPVRVFHQGHAAAEAVGFGNRGVTQPPGARAARVFKLPAKPVIIGGVSEAR